MNQRMLSLWVIVCCLFLCPIVVLADSAGEQVCDGDTCFPSRLRIGTTEIDLLGSARFRYLFFHVYTAAFYGDAQWRNATKFPTDSLSELVLQYHHAISADEIAESANVWLAKQNANLPDAVAAAISQVHSRYRDVRPGDRYALRYEPNKGTSLYFNGEFVVQIEEPKFAEYYFRIWLDAERPMDEKLRDRLLGRL